jgi:hypothetical protein
MHLLLAYRRHAGRSNERGLRLRRSMCKLNPSRVLRAQFLPMALFENNCANGVDGVLRRAAPADDLPDSNAKPNDAHLVSWVNATTTTGQQQRSKRVRRPPPSSPFVARMVNQMGFLREPAFATTSFCEGEHLSAMPW